MWEVCRNFDNCKNFCRNWDIFQAFYPQCWVFLDAVLELQEVDGCVDLVYAQHQQVQTSELREGQQLYHQVLATQSFHLDVNHQEGGAFPPD